MSKKAEIEIREPRGAQYSVKDFEISDDLESAIATVIQKYSSIESVKDELNKLEEETSDMFRHG